MCYVLTIELSGKQNPAGKKENYERMQKNNVQTDEQEYWISAGPWPAVNIYVWRQAE